MNTPLSFIKEYVPELNCTDQEYTDAMTLSGTKVENFERLDEKLDKIVIGQIIKIEGHPDADKLKVCQVNIGTETIQIVTNATNIYEGVKLPVVLDGGKIFDGTKIKKGKLRGVESFGMFCSIEEFGSSKDFYPEQDEEGIYRFSDDAVVGSDAIKELGFRDTVFEYEVTSNRVDCFGVLGIAREAAATFRKPFNPPVVKETGNGEDVNDLISVSIEDSDLCKRYCARVVKNVVIKPSPLWLQRRLASCGIRPINNVVDITNFVMEEFGQPMHAYDLSTISGNKIIVRRGKDGEVFKTLDGQDRKIDEQMLLICDEVKPVAIAGIMGGEDSKVTDEVKDILFEAASFDGTNIRLTSKRLGLRTDASSKFEKGLDPENAKAAIDRACELIMDLEAGEVMSNMVDEYPVKAEVRRIPFDENKANRLLGTNVSLEEILTYFEMLELTYDSEKKEVIIPSFRQDLICDADLAEEVARFYGYDNIPTTLPSGEATAGKLSYKLRIENVAKDVAEFCGFSQAMTYSFESPKVFDKLLIPSDSKIRETVNIINPLGEDFSIMRTISLNGMLTSLSTNFNRRNKAVKLYELGNIYIPNEIPVTTLPTEKMMMTLGMYGEGDFFTMKGVVEEFFDKIGMFKKEEYDPTDKKVFLHPGRQADIKYDGKVVGYIGEIHPQVLDNYDIGERVYVAVLDMNEIVALSTFERKYEGIAKYPAITRDIAMVMKKEILVGDIEKIFEKRGGKLLESFNLFDIYEGSQIKEGHKSVAYSLVFRAKDRTLEDKEVVAVMDKILAELAGMDIELRA